MNDIYNISRDFLVGVIKLLFKVEAVDPQKVPEPPYVVASNHTSNIDPPLLGLICKKDKLDFMAKQELFDIPLVGIWFNKVNCIPVKRGQNSVKSLKEAIFRLKSGSAIAMFPEGTRSESGAIQEAKRGVGFLILKAGVPVVPVYIHGTNAAYPKGGRIKMGTEVKVIAGDPIFKEEFERELRGEKDYEKVAQYVMTRIEKIKEEKGL